jgi:hypothetical protein
MPPGGMTSSPPMVDIQLTVVALPTGPTAVAVNIWVKQDVTLVRDRTIMSFAHTWVHGHVVRWDRRESGPGGIRRPDHGAGRQVAHRIPSGESAIASSREFHAPRGRFISLTLLVAYGVPARATQIGRSSDMIAVAGTGP